MLGLGEGPVMQRIADSEVCGGGGGDEFLKEAYGHREVVSGICGTLITIS